ncbi:MAG: HEAT repeat domain-containing protein [Planctomycetota bacterium]
MRMTSRNFASLMVFLVVCAAPCRAEGAEGWAELHKKFRMAFKPLRLPKAAQLEKMIVPELPGGVVIEPGPFEALARRLREPFEAKITRREEVMKAFEKEASVKSGKAIKDALKIMAKENREIAKSVSWVESNYSGAYNRGFMDSSAKEKQVRKVAAVLIPFYLGLMGRNEAVMELSVAALGAMRDGEGLKWLTNQALKDSEASLRDCTVRALVGIGGDVALLALKTAAIKDGDSKVRARALNGLMAWKLEAVKDTVIAALNDPSWEVRAVAVTICGLGKLVEATEALIEALGNEEGRLRQDIDDALFLLVGARYYGDGELWKKWFEANRAKVEVKAAELAQSGEYSKALGPVTPGRGLSAAPGDAEEGKEATTSFYGISTFSKKLIYIIDISRSMESPAGASAPEATGGRGGPYTKPKGQNKIDIARWQLHRAVHALPKDAVFNIIVYSESYRVWKKTMTPAHPKLKAEAHDFIDVLKPNGTTNIYDSLVKALEIAGAAPPGAVVTGRKKQKELAADTIYLLSDGNPNRGRLTDAQKIVEDIRERNPGIVIHTIGIGEAAGAPLLKNLAAENGGHYVAFK